LPCPRGRALVSLNLAMELSIPTPPGFGFRRTVLSHGWCELPPFHFDRENWSLSRVLLVGQRKAREISIQSTDGGLTVSTPGNPAKKDLAAIAKSVRHMLRLDEDLSPFYLLAASHPGFSWIPVEGAGRLLRAPTVFEDLVKMMCTTNCSWALTDKMVNALVTALGTSSKSARRAFPTPEAMAAVSVSFYKDEASAGYRAPYLKELADRVASGELDPEGWLTTDLPTPELKKEMKAIKGVGDYVAENILRLLGRYDGMALDSWIRGKFGKMYARGRAVSDKRIGRHYSKFGKWNGLALWCDVTRDWIQ
jgi:3-methyladenine DNA glycosylase/8-oxoguanine DNA glycosylase